MWPGRSRRDRLCAARCLTHRPPALADGPAIRDRGLGRVRSAGWLPARDSTDDGMGSAQDVADRSGVRTDSSHAGWIAARASSRSDLDPRRWPSRAARLPCAGSDPAARQMASTDLGPVALLSAVARHGFTSTAASRRHMPLSARTMLEKWSDATPPTLDDVRADLVRVAALPDRVLRPRRALPIALGSLPTLFLVGFTSLVMLPAMSQMFNRDTNEMLAFLEMLRNPKPAAQSRAANPEVREAIEIYLAGRHGARLNSDDFWGGRIMQGLSPQYRPIARGVVERRPSVTPEELARATEVLAPELKRRGERREEISDLSPIIIMAVTAIALLPVLLFSVLSSLLVPGGVFTRMLGHAVVKNDGREIGRTLSLVRVLVAWAPTITWLLYLAAWPRVQGFVPTPPNPLLGATLTVAAMAVGALLTIAKPARGPHDWLLGTRVVPR